MSSFEQLFSSTTLNVVVPDTSLEYPPRTPVDDWLGRVNSGVVERKQAFFDEQLLSLLMVRINHPTSGTPADTDHPPPDLLAFLAHLQVSLEATYISSLPAPVPDVPHSSRLSAPPRTTSLAMKHASRLNPHHPSILPPSTPNPTPAAADHDRRYVTSEGTLLLASIWGQNMSEDSRESFALLWSDEEQVWVATYQLAFTVSFLRLNFPEPLLCLTVSVTLREKPTTLNSPKHPLAIYFASVGTQSALAFFTTPTSINGRSSEGLIEDELDGLEEVNLLEGLLAGPTFFNPESPPISLPSIRLGIVSRRNLFSLPPVASPTPVATSPTTAARTAHPTLRKSFRRTLQTVSGFRVRMRTVFVPYVFLPDTEGSDVDLDEVEDERERREAGNEERTVVLCVEVENSGESGPGVGFAVEKVDVNVGGEGAKATLIGWGDDAFTKQAEKKTFPLLMESRGQYNLLYAVSFLRSPQEADGFSLTRDTTVGTDLQRAVAINIYGKPYAQSETGVDNYPTNTFSSRWNCVLDLSTHNNKSVHTLDASDPTDLTSRNPNALPEPASPFPVSVSRTSGVSSNANNAPSSTLHSTAIAGAKRHTLPGNTVATRSIKSSPQVNFRASTSMLNPKRDRDPPQLPSSARMSYLPPSITVQIPRSPTTFAPPPPPPDSADVHATNMSLSTYDQVPPTPAYPAYPPHSSTPPTPMSQGPIASNASGGVGPSVEIRRERATGMSGSPSPQTPGPSVHGGGSGEQGPSTMRQLQNVEDSGEAVAVSIGLLPPADGKRRRTSILGPGKIYPLDSFTLDIFVFNQSVWTRRFEVSCPHQRRRGGGATYDGQRESMRKLGYPGILPLENRVRIGPLRPSACQSVRMKFLAVTPGVHSIDILTLTDVESGFSMNLRSVMDVVVHDPTD